MRFDGEEIDEDGVIGDQDFEDRDVVEVYVR